jgi:hypothetical protein
MPFPCRAKKGLNCIFPIWFAQCGRVWITHAMPRPCHAVLKATSQGHGTARNRRGMACVNLHRPSRDGMWAACPRSAHSGYHAEFHEGYQKHSNPLNCRTSISDISGYHADFHEMTLHCRRMAGARYGMCEITRHGMAGERHGSGNDKNKKTNIVFDCTADFNK